MTGIGAQRKHVTLLTDFRSSPENGHSRYGHPTARFAPMPSLRMDPAECPHSNILWAAFDNTQRGLGRRERHVEGNYGLGEAFEGERANLFGHDAPL